MRVEIIQREQVSKTIDNSPLSIKLLEIANKCNGLSGRALRKLPFLAHALFVQKQTVTCTDYLHALDQAVQRETLVREQLN
jgi:hypothetical protein